MKTSLLLTFLISLTNAAKKQLGEKCIFFNNDYQVSDLCVNSSGEAEEETLKCCKAIYQADGLNTSFNLCTNTA